ncbi:MAG TPA: hypothetical protein VJ723_01355, partial [Candidatus Angelobacter sp.]|nr:hypothetical protein [Candidatus Angelobacter sp.]
LKIWEIKTGKLLRELSYGVYGVRGTLAAHVDSPIIAAITNSGDPADIRRDHDRPGFSKWLLFDIKNPEPIYVSPKLSLTNLGDGIIRMSADGTRVAVSQHGIIEIFEVTPSNLSTKPGTGTFSTSSVSNE